MVETCLGAVVDGSQGGYGDRRNTDFSGDMPQKAQGYGVQVIQRGTRHFEKTQLNGCGNAQSILAFLGDLCALSLAVSKER
ncbi:MAG: hypothetical protein U1E84_03905 [Rhodoferax sp.]